MKMLQCNSGKRNDVLQILWRVVVREARRMVEQPIYLLCMFGVPLITALFFLTMLHEGLPEHIPVAIVDMDNTALSRAVLSNLAVQQSVNVVERYDSFTVARHAMQEGKIYGFLIIPERFQQLLMDGKQPVISFYTNDAYLIPGSLLFKSFKTVSVLASAAVAQNLLSSLGMTSDRIAALLQPIAVELHPLGNPWLNYSVYLNNSFLPTVLQLIVLLVTVFSLCGEMKQRTLRSWMGAARGSVVMAVIGKLLLHATVFVAVGWFLQSLLYGYLHFPMQGSLWSMMTAMVLLVLSTQSVAFIIVSLSPSIPLAYSAASVLGVVSFSLGGFSFPVLDMYMPFRLLTQLLPVRHYFLIYVNNALNGYPIYYSRYEFVALLLFISVAILLLPRFVRLIRRLP